MTAPNRGTITASIERSLRNCSLNHHQSGSSSSNNSASAGIIGPEGFVAAGRSSTSDSTINLDFPDNTLELHSDIRLPYYWEQCLDLKSGEVYYINWRTGMKSQEDPRTTPGMQHVMNGGLSWSEEDEDDGWYESEGSSTEESSPSTSSGRRQQQCRHHSNSSSSPATITPRHHTPTTATETNIHHHKPQQPQPPPVLVVAGCKSCFMYFMLPKQVQDCPKCFGQLLHFDRSENASP